MGLTASTMIPFLVPAYYRDQNQEIGLSHPSIQRHAGRFLRTSLPTRPESLGKLVPSTLAIDRSASRDPKATATCLDVSLSKLGEIRDTRFANRSRGSPCSRRIPAADRRSSAARYA